MRLRTLFFGALLCWALAGKAASQTNAVRLLTLQECVELALQHNLEIQIEKFTPRISTYDLAGTYSVYDPVLNLAYRRSFVQSPGTLIPGSSVITPASKINANDFSTSISGEAPWTGLRYDMSTDTAQTKPGALPFTSSHGLSLTQPLLRNFWIDQGRLNIRAARKTLQISESTFVQQVMRIVTRVEEAYYDLIFARENVRVQESALQLAERLLSENRKRVEVGALAPLDEKQAESQLAVSRADLISAQQTLDAQENALKKLITQDFVAWHEVRLTPAERLLAIPETFNVIESWRRGVTQRPELIQLKLDLERRDIVIRFQKNQTLPEVDLVGSYGYASRNRTWDSSLNDVYDARNPRYSAGVVVSVPLGNRGPRNAYRSTKAQQEQALLRYKKQEQDILVEIDDAVKRARSSFERVEATRQGRLYAEAALDAEQKKLENGKSTSFVVLQLQRDLTAARSSEIRALADYNKALAELTLSEGETLEKNRVTVDWH